MSKIQLPPKKQLADANPEPKKPVSEKKIQEFIAKGGSSSESLQKVEGSAEEDKLRNFAIKLQDSLLLKVKQACQLRPPKSAWKKTRISMQDWFIEAIEEKLKRELK